MIFKIIVTGRVQGVNFRRMTRDFCLDQGVKGRVKNLDNGEVEIYVQCDEHKKDLLINWLKLNPGFSRVNNIRVEEITERMDFEGFEIVREGNLLTDQTKSAKNLGKKILKL